MTRQRGLMLGSILAGIALGTWGITRHVPEGTVTGNRLPDYRVLDLATGDSVGLRTGFAGHVTLVNLWATYCIPCRKEMPSMERLYQGYRARGFRIAAVSLDDQAPASVMEYAKELGVSFEILQDRSNLSLQQFQGIGLPYSVLLDREGRVRYVSLGAEDWNSAESRARVEALLPPP